MKSPTKEILYYTDNRLSSKIMAACQRQLLKVGLLVISVSLQPIDFGQNIVLDAKRGVLTMFRQILAGLEASTADVIFFGEHDIIYHPSHFEFTPSRCDVFYYNTNVWKVRYDDGHAVWTDNLQQTSGLCAYRELLLAFYQRRVIEIEQNGFDRHFEPGPKTSSFKAENWQSAYPNLDIRHGQTLTRSKWAPDEFRNQRYAKGWREADSVPYWGQTGGKIKEILNA